MVENTDQNTIGREALDTENLKKTLIKYLRYWPLFILSVIIFLSAAKLYLRYSTSIFETNAKIKILKKDQGGLDMSSLQGGSTIFDFGKINLSNEAEILKSRRIIEKVVRKLNLNTSFYRQGSLKKVELWGDEIPIEVEWYIDENSSTPYFELQVIDQNTFQLSQPESDFTSRYKFNEVIEYKDLSFKIQVTNKRKINSAEETLYTFRQSSTEQTVSSLIGKLKVETTETKSEILDISVVGENKDKNEAIVNNLVEQFNQDGVNDNRNLAQQTEAFALDRLKFLYQELDTVDANLVDFKTTSNIITVESSTSELFSKTSQLEQEAFRLETELLNVRQLEDRLSNAQDFSYLPTDIGETDGKINSVLKEHNELITEREQLLITSTETSFIIQNINTKILNLRKVILSSIRSYKQSLVASKKRLIEKERLTNQSLTSLPEKEKRIQEIKREQTIKERLYLFLLQKREEAALSSAVVPDIIKIVDYAYTKPGPVSPRSTIIYLASFFVSLILPFSILYVSYLLNTKINEKLQITSILPNTPILGEIPLIAKSEPKLVGKNRHNPLSESFRIIRTNLNYLGLNKSDAKIVNVTSSIKGEGKTLIATNLAAMLSTGHNKCLLVGADLRNPQIHNFINRNKNIDGISKYLYDKTTTFEKILLKKPLDEFNLDIVLSGVIPPNPTELLLSDRFEEFIEEAKKRYDYIIVDTAPTLLVTDTFLISKYANITVYSVRANHTDAELLNHIKEIKNAEKIDNIGVVFNAVDSTGSYAYNYGYGYGYNDKTSRRNRLKFW